MEELEALGLIKLSQAVARPYTVAVLGRGLHYYDPPGSHWPAVPRDTCLTPAAEC